MRNDKIDKNNSYEYKKYTILLRHVGYLSILLGYMSQWDQKTEIKLSIYMKNKREMENRERNKSKYFIENLFPVVYCYWEFWSTPFQFEEANA